jgi:hypothetical protein
LRRSWRWSHLRKLALDLSDNVRKTVFNSLDGNDVTQKEHGLLIKDTAPVGSIPHAEVLLRRIITYPDVHLILAE